MNERKKVCSSSPPNRAVWWDIDVKGCPVMKRGFGQTAFKAAAHAGLLLSEVQGMHVSDDQSEPESCIVQQAPSPDYRIDETYGQRIARETGETGIRKGV